MPPEAVSRRPLTSRSKRPELITREWVRGPADELAIAEGCYFDDAAGRYTCDFMERFCKQSQGKKWAGQPFTLLDWQRDYNMRLYGWKRKDGTRRYRTSYLEVPKKNGKSTMISTKALYHLMADGEPAAECYINAYDLNQTRIIFEESCRMVRKSPALAKRLKIVPSSKQITFAATESKLTALSNESESKDGFNASYTVFDELHRQRSPAMFDIFTYAGEARDQPLLESITTAGSDRNSICFRQHDYTKKVNSGLIEDTSHLGVIYAADPADDIENPATWHKANPSLGITIKVEDFQKALRKALAQPGGLNNFLRLRLNIWTNATTRFLERDQWDACGELEFDPAELRGLPCYGGLDLSLTTDLTAFAMIWIGPDGTVYAQVQFWAPEDRAEIRETRDRVPYLHWANKGFLTLTPGSVVDYDYVKAEIIALHDRYSITKLFVDPIYATQVSIQLRDQAGIPLDFLRQGYTSLTAPTRELERLVMSRRLAHGNNPVLNWMADNAVATTDAAGGVKLDKAKATERIDGMAALVNAFGAWMAAAGDTGKSVYERRGLLVF